MLNILAYFTTGKPRLTLKQTFLMLTYGRKRLSL